LISNDFLQLDRIIKSKFCIIIFSQELLEEFIEVSSRPKFIKYFEKSSLDKILENIEEFAEFIEVHSAVIFFNDSKDDFLLSLAVDGNADYLITGDKELLEVKKYCDTEIISISDFISKYEI
jgi:putative PIN family toxin of toxin-antitoxin system